MQIDNVFLNVSKGQAANKDDLLKCFKTEDRNAIILEVSVLSMERSITKSHQCRKQDTKKKVNHSSTLDLEKGRNASGRKGAIINVGGHVQGYRHHRR